MPNDRQQNGNDQALSARPSNGVGRWMRIAVMFLSGGFIFPNVLSEDEDGAAFGGDQAGKSKEGPAKP